MSTKLRTPLRYPGGKKRLANFVEFLISRNGLKGCDYVEPYAGGAGLAIELLNRGVVNSIWLNDIDGGVSAFWNAVLNHSDEFCQLIDDTPVTIEEWFKQKELLCNSSGLKRAFAFFFLNRTNRSGILTAGVIGGKAQSGKWKVDCRFNKADLISRIQNLALARDSIHFSNADAVDFMNQFSTDKTRSLFFYLDPPYYLKGAGLYFNAYCDDDHEKVSETVRQFKSPWIVSYDNHEFIRNLYQNFPCLEYDLNYSAHLHTQGREVIFFGNLNFLPDSVDNIGLFA